MRRFWYRLLAQAPQRRSVLVIDRRLELAASDTSLLEGVASLLSVDGESSDVSGGGDFCLLAYTDAVPDWRRTLDDVPGRRADQPEMGSVNVYRPSWGTVAVQEDIGALVLLDDGGLLLLVEPRPLGLAASLEPNLANLVNLLRSEISLRSGRLMVHAAAVGREGSCELWTGASGIGKTTTALGYVANGWDFFGDDQVILEPDRAGDRWTVWPHWRPPKVTAETRRLLPELAILPPSGSATEKHSFHVGKVYDVERPKPGRLSAIHLLTAKDDARPRRLEGAEAFRKLSPQLLHYVWTGNAATALEWVLDLVSAVPVDEVPRPRWPGTTSDDRVAPEAGERRVKALR